MAKAKRMTLKQAAELLKTTAYPYGLPAIQKAAIGGKLKAELIDGPLPYYLVNETDVIAWASDASQHKAGRPSKAKQVLQQ